jgi:hypothetical protein
MKKKQHRRGTETADASNRASFEREQRLPTEENKATYGGNRHSKGRDNR